MLELTTGQNAVLLRVKVIPGASRTRLMGVLDGRAKIGVAAAAEKGKANEALTGFLAKLLGVRRRDVAVVSGRTSPLKTIRIEGVTLDAVRAAMKPDRS